MHHMFFGHFCIYGSEFDAFLVVKDDFEDVPGLWASKPLRYSPVQEVYSSADLLKFSEDLLPHTFICMENLASHTGIQL